MEVKVITEAEIKVSDLCASWPKEHLANLAAILEIKQEDNLLEQIDEQIKWLFHSKLRAKGKAVSKRGWNLLLKKKERVTVAEQYDIPTYLLLLTELSKKRGIKTSDAGMHEMEQFFCDKVIVDAISGMTAPQRRRAFEASMELGEAAKLFQQDKHFLRKAAGGASALTLANAAGFSLYTSATTALSLLAGAANITLPFAAYTGMSSFIAAVIGPAGWAALGAYLVTKATSPDWNKLTIALIYIISVRSGGEKSSSSSIFR